MKKRLLIAILIALFIFPSMAQAVGTLTGHTGVWTQVSKNVYKKTLTFVDDTNGTTGTVTLDSTHYGWKLWHVQTDPGTTAPTVNYDIVLKRGDTNGEDMMGGTLNNRHNSNTESAYPATGTPIMDTDIFFALSGNSVNNGTGTVTIYIYK